MPRNELGQFVYRETRPDQPLLDAGVEAPKLAEPEQWLVTERRRNQTGHCFVGGFVELLNVFDTSSNVKILDYRMMKEAVKVGFLTPPRSESSPI